MRIKLTKGADSINPDRQTCWTKVNARGRKTPFAVKFLFHLFMAVVLPAPVFAQEQVHVTGAEITEVGIYTSQVITDATNGAGLKLQGLDEFKLLENTTNVPAQMGIRFGFRYEILGAPANAPIILTIIGRHPPLTNSATGKAETVDAYQIKSRIGKTYTSCSLSEKSDCVPGPWVFEVWHEGRKLCEQAFLVVRGKETP
jgi:hypothetical protein